MDDKVVLGREMERIPLRFVQYKSNIKQPISHPRVALGNHTSRRNLRRVVRHVLALKIRVQSWLVGLFLLLPLALGA
jgi:hypothetical protein